MLFTKSHTSRLGAHISRNVLHASVSVASVSRDVKCR